MKNYSKLYKQALINLINNGGFNIAITFNFNPTDDEEGCIKIKDIQPKISRFNCLFFSKLYGSRWYKKIQPANLHIIEHELSNIHTHAVYKISSSSIKVNIRDIVKLDELANNLFSQVWDKGTVCVSALVSGDWAYYMTKHFKYNRNEDSFFVI